MAECKSDGVQDKSDTDTIANVIVKEEWEDCDEEVKEEQESLLIETYEGYAGTVKDETDEFMPYEDLDFQTVTLLIDETGRVRRAEIPRDIDDEEDLEENSKSDEDPSVFDSLEDLKEQSSDLDPFQNIIKPVIWCTDCTDVAKMICTIRRHKKIYGCTECSGDAWEENSTFKNFSVHFCDITSFHKHAVKEHSAQEIPPVQNRVSKNPHKTIRMWTNLNKKRKRTCSLAQQSLAEASPRRWQRPRRRGPVDRRFLRYGEAAWTESLEKVHSACWGWKKRQRIGESLRERYV